MKTQALAVAALALVWMGCPSGPGPADGGPELDAGPTGDSDSGVEVDGGGGGNPTAIAFNQLCSNVTSGFRESLYQETAACGKPVTRADIDHLFYTWLPQYNFYLSHEEAFAGSDCSVTDGGLATQMGRYAEAISAGRLGYDPAKAYLCREKGRTRDGGAADFAICNDVFSPKVAAGGACQANYECMGDTYCKTTNELSCAGTCQPRLAVGTPCSPVRDSCVAVAACQAGADGGYSCAELLNAGDDCTDDDECKPGMLCFDDGTDMKCTALAALNAACVVNPDGDDTCDEGVCVTANGSSSGTCTAPATLGQPCGDNTNGKPQCDSCTACLSGTCAHWGRAGDTCATDDECFDTQIYFCNAGSCQVRARQGEACLGGASNGGSGSCMYYDNFCKKNSAGGAGTPGVCTPLPKLGEACGTTFDKTPSCAEGYCRGDTGTCAPLAGVNGACTTSNTYNGLSPRCVGDDLFCDTRPDAGGTGTNGTCRTANAAGGACDDELPCASNAYCGDAGTCVGLAAIGGACASDDECLSGWCEAATDGGAGACAAKRAVGVACDEDQQCESDVCDPLSKKCSSTCGVASNDAGGCMNYDLGSLSFYLIFAVVLAPALRRRRK